MSRHEINIRLGAEDAASGKLSKVGKASTDLGTNIKKLGNVFGEFGSISGSVLSNFLRGSVWGIAGDAVRGIIGLVGKAYNSIKESIAEAQKTADENLDKMISKIGEYKSAVQEAADAERKAVEATLSARNKEIDLTERLTKANIELARQKRIAAGEDAATVNGEADAATAGANASAARGKADAAINAAYRRVDAANSARDAAWAEVERLRGARAGLEDAEYYNTPGSESTYKKALAYQKALDRQILDARRVAFGADDKAKEEEKSLQNALKAREAIEQEIEAGDLRAANEARAKKDADDKAAAERKAAEEKAAAAKVAAERERLDREEAMRRERERQKDLADRIRDHQTLLAEERKSVSAEQSRVAAATAKEQQAWSWYRDKDSLRAQLDEEKANAEAEKQFEKEFDKLRGKYRDWRDAKNLSLDEESVRRVGKAREEKEAAEKHLAEIEKNTADLANKLDELLQVK